MPANRDHAHVLDRLAPGLLHPPERPGRHLPPAALAIERVVRRHALMDDVPGPQDQEPEIRVPGHGPVCRIRREGIQLFHGRRLPPVFHRVGQRLDNIPASLRVPSLPMEADPVAQIQRQHPGRERGYPIDAHEDLLHGRLHRLFLLSSLPVRELGPASQKYQPHTNTFPPEKQVFSRQKARGGSNAAPCPYYRMRRKAPAFRYGECQHKITPLPRIRAVRVISIGTWSGSWPRCR